MQCRLSYKGDIALNKTQVLKEKLRSKGYKITRQREAILEVFAVEDSHLLTAQELFEKIQENQAGTNFSTVYRNLELLLQEGIIRKVELNREAAYYELHDDKGHHHHLVCNRCGSIQTTDFCPLDRLKSEDGFIPVEHRFEIYGYCRDCVNSQDLKGKGKKDSKE